MLFSIIRAYNVSEFTVASGMVVSETSTMTIISTSNNCKNEIEMYSTRLQPLSSLLGTSFSRFFLLKKIRDEMRGMEDVFLCIIIALPLNISIRVYIVPVVFTEELYQDLVCSSTLILLDGSASSVKARNGWICRKSSLIFFSWRFFVYLLCKEHTAKEDEEVERYSRVAGKRTAESILIGNLNAPDWIIHSVCVCVFAIIIIHYWALWEAPN